MTENFIANDSERETASLSLWPTRDRRANWFCLPSKHTHRTIHTLVHTSINQLENTPWSTLANHITIQASLGPMGMDCTFHIKLSQGIQRNNSVVECDVCVAACHRMMSILVNSKFGLGSAKNCCLLIFILSALFLCVDYDNQLYVK